MLLPSPDGCLDDSRVFSSMSTSTSDADEKPASTAPDRPEDVNPWVVRFFLILAFGLAFGIEGMTLVRGYLLNGEEDAEPVVQRQGEAERPSTQSPSDAPLRVGDDLLPATDVTERVVQMQIRAQSSGLWTFRLGVAVENETEMSYRLTLRALETDDGTVLEGARTATWAPGDSSTFVATWPMAVDARPQSLTAEAELQSDADSTRPVRRRVSFGHIPVRMER